MAATGDEAVNLRQLSMLMGSGSSVTIPEAYVYGSVRIYDNESIYFTTFSSKGITATYAPLFTFSETGIYLVTVDLSGASYNKAIGSSSYGTYIPSNIAPITMNSNGGYYGFPTGYKTSYFYEVTSSNENLRFYRGYDYSLGGAEFYGLISIEKMG